ncbi:MAG: hypothetical protein ABI602_00730 [Candidatus Saccharibacteria bacterium]
MINSKHVYLLMIAFIFLLTVGLFGSAYGIQGLLQVKSSELVGLKAKLSAVKEQQGGLVQAKKDITTYNDLYKIAKVVVPENKNQAEAVRQIVKLAANNSIRLGSISFPSSTLGNVAGSATTALPPPTVTSPSSAASAALSQLTPVLAAPGVYVLQINVNSDSNYPASYPQLISFLAALEQNRLTAQVTSLNITPDPNNPDRFSFILTLNSYIKP